MNEEFNRLNYKVADVEKTNNCRGCCACGDWELCKHLIDECTGNNVDGKQVTIFKKIEGGEK